MKRIKAPNWIGVLKDNAKKLAETMMRAEVMDLINKANQEYLPWEKFRYQKMPTGLNPDFAWALVKIGRNSNRENFPIICDGQNLWMFSSTNLLKSLSYIDSWTSGAISSTEGLPTGPDHHNLVINGLIEEAISSSQIEGANTTRRVAKTMIELNKQPQNKSERMILNNYLAMSSIEEWKTRPLDESLLLDLHRILTSDTLDQKNDEGRFRNDSDEIVVLHEITGETVHTPPNEMEMHQQLKQLFAFANDEESKYIHPYIKASVLHFCLGYIHPFVDGNGRLARAIFYWYLIKKNYWMFKYLPISLQIKKKEWRPGYDRAFQYVENDELDLTYFIIYKLKVAQNAIADFLKYIQKKQNDANKLKQRLIMNSEINHRQVDLIEFLQTNPTAQVDIEFYKNRHKIVYETARTDLMQLVKNKILKSLKHGRKYVYTRGERFPVK